MERKSIIHGLSIYLPLIVIILTSGCTATRMYKGEELPKQEIAVIKGSQNLYFGWSASVEIYRIDDGEERKLSSLPILRRLVSEVEVIPGFHKVFVIVKVWGATYHLLDGNLQIHIACSLLLRQGVDTKLKWSTSRKETHI